MKKIALAAVVLASFSASATAADLPSSYAPPYAPLPLFTWTGLYAGVNGGLGVGSFTSGGASYFGNAVGGLVGGTAGYNFQSGALLVGIEGDFDAANVSGGRNPFPSVTGYGNMTSMLTVRGRLGYAVDRALVYVTGGYAGATVRGNLFDYSTAPSFVVGTTHYLNGFAVGAGVEYAFTNHISVKAEYLFSSFMTSGYFGGTPDAIANGLNVSTIKAGVAYHF